MKTICIYHSADLDGAGSAAIVLFAEGKLSKRMQSYAPPSPSDAIELIPLNYDHAHPTIPDDAKVYMVDFALQPPEAMRKLAERLGSRLIWIDHHKATIEDPQLKGLTNPGIRDTKFAGCELTWQYFYPDVKIPTGIQLIGRYDVFDKAAKVAASYDGDSPYEWDAAILPFQYGLRAEGLIDPTNPLWRELLIDSIDVDDLIVDGQKILRYVKQDLEGYAKAASFETSLDGHSAVAINRGLCGSHVFESVKQKKHDLLIGFWMTKTRQWTVSLYTDRKDLDCGLLAKKYGGSGHPGAAGFQCTELPFKTSSKE